MIYLNKTQKFSQTGFRSKWEQRSPELYKGGEENLSLEQSKINQLFGRKPKGYEAKLIR